MRLIQASTFVRLFFHTLPFFLRVGAQSLELQVSKLQSECGILYTVVAGDGCWAIAENAHITQAQLTALNPGLDCGTIGIGDGLCLGLPCGQTYEVAMGDWCAKIQDEQGVSESDLISLNPGLACEELFPGQHLCLAPPVVDPPTEPGETPPDLPPLFPDPVPVVPCNIQVPIALGDTCSDLATSNHIQLSQFTALNENLDCDNLSPGNIACVAPGCRTIYRVQSGDWCSKIEGDFSLTAGQLTGLNPGLSCENLAPDQVLCVDPPDEIEEESPEPGITYASAYPVLSPGEDVPQSPLVSFVNSDDPRDSFFGDLLFQGKYSNCPQSTPSSPTYTFTDDSQHRAAFSRLDANSDGKIDLNELNEIISASPRLTRGTTEVVDSLTHSEFAQRLMEAADTNEDGFIDEDEYMRAIVSSQNITSYATDLAFEASQNGDVRERAIPLLVVGAGLLLGLFVSMSFVDLMHHLEAKARVKAGDMLKYLDVTFWERGKEDEPKCSAYMYYSTSCAALGHHWSSHCSEGGEKVFDKSCRVPFADGAKACGFLGCSSLCYKVSTEGCDCDALKYHAEEGVAYNDPPISTTDEIGVGACRRRCRDTSGCIGFSVGPGSNDRRVSCKTFGLMATPTASSQSASFMLSPSCPRPPEGYTALSFAQMMRSYAIGIFLSNLYAWRRAGNLRKRQSSSCPLTPPRRRDIDLSSNWTTDPPLQLETNWTIVDDAQTHTVSRRAPNRVDYRSTYPQTVKSQTGASWCSTFTFTSVVEGTVMRTFQRNTNVPLSPLWVAWCRVGTTPGLGSWFTDLYDKVRNSYIATESCLPFSLLMPDNSECRNNGCAASQYGKLPYITRHHSYPQLFSVRGVFLNTAESLKTHLETIGPLYMVFSVSNGFENYGYALAQSNAPEDQWVFYDTHPSWPSTCAYTNHAMTVVGYGHYRRSNDPCGVSDRLYWIVLNSWGPGFGRNGHVFIELGSLSNGQFETHGVNVNEGTQFFFNDLPVY